MRYFIFASEVQTNISILTPVVLMFTSGDCGQLQGNMCLRQVRPALSSHNGSHMSQYHLTNDTPPRQHHTSHITRQTLHVTHYTYVQHYSIMLIVESPAMSSMSSDDNIVCSQLRQCVMSGSWHARVPRGR